MGSPEAYCPPPLGAYTVETRSTEGVHQAEVVRLSLLHSRERCVPLDTCSPAPLWGRGLGGKASCTLPPHGELKCK